MCLTTEVITQTNQSLHAIETNSNLVSELLLLMKGSASKVASGMPMLNVHQVLAHINATAGRKHPGGKMTPVKLEWYYRADLPRRRAANRARYQQIVAKLTSLLPELQEFGYRQATWLCNSMSQLVKTFNQNEKPVLAGPHGHTGGQTPAKAKAKAKAKPKAVTSRTETETAAGDSKLVVDIQLPDAELDLVVETSLDPELTQDQDEHDDLVRQVWEQYQQLIHCEFQQREVEHIQRSLDELVRISTKAPGANQQAVEAVLAPTGSELSFAAWIATQRPPQGFE
jgi:hypothetical protein